MMPPDLPSQRRKILDFILVPRQERQVSRALPRDNDDAATLDFLVDDGVTCPPNLAQAGRLPLRSGLGRIGANRRLVQKTGEFGRVQV